MKTLLMTLFILISATSVFAEEVNITVNGMVCSFCAQGIKKNFKKLSEIQDVKPDLEKHQVTVVTKPEAILTDGKIREIITDAGYEVVKIERAK